MNHHVFLVMVVMMAMAAVVLLSCARVDDSEVHATKINSAANEEAEKPIGLLPLAVDENAPLLLDESAEAEKPTVMVHLQRIDNAACFVCHANYMTEPLASQHAAANIGCIDCHGKSYAHYNDENNITPPDIMYRADEIDNSCRKCHAAHNAPAVEVIARWQQLCPDKTDPATIVCTDCHGNHRLKPRTVRWDKKTGNLVRGH